MIKRFCVVFVAFLILLIPITAYATPTYFSNLPEPFPTEAGTTQNKFLVADIAGTPFIFSFTFPLADDELYRLYLTHSNSGYELKFDNLSGSDVEVLFVTYNAKTGATSGYYKPTVRNGKTFTLYRNVNMLSATSYGVQILLEGSYILPACSIAWADSTDPSTYTNWLSDIYTRQGNIQLDLEIFYNAFDTFRQVNHQDLTQIYSLLNKIYELLGANAEVPESSTVSTSELDEYQSLEDSLMVDKSAELESIADFDIGFADDVEVNTSHVVITATSSAIPFINQLLEKFVLGNPAILPMCILALTAGVFVLILGRKTG